MPATAPWLASAEALLNRNIDASAQATALARRLDGTRLALDVTHVTSVHAAVAGSRLALFGEDGTAADARITGTPTALLALLRGGGAPVRSSAVTVSGNAEVANLYRELLAAARPDLEEELARWVGDLPARQITRFARGAGEWLSRARRTARENVAEYLTEESRDLVAHTEAEEFLHGVDEVREAADRFEARLKALERRRQDAG